ncbi:signal peptidase I [Microbacterium sp. NPDC077663]|uniref:signal peptidase I n=1 Tax=Microbacterium sp. NPDC077663 TaxID=3364189 RepID=UPI0037C7983D
MRLLSIGRWLLIAVLAAVLAAPVLLTALTAQHTLEVTGGSMAPTYQRGDLVIIDPARIAEIGAGDVVTVRRTDGVLYTHRVTSISPNGVITTRGDANPVADTPTVTRADIAGVVTIHVPQPWAGMVTASQSLPGRISLALVLSGLIFLPTAQRTWTQQTSPTSRKGVRHT